MKRQPIIGEIDVRGQLTIHRFVVHVMAHVSEIRLFGLKSLTDGQCFFNTQMSRVWLVTQRIENQYVEALKLLHARLGNLIHVGAIGNVIDAKAENVKMCVLQGDWDNFMTKDSERLGVNPMQIELRNVRFDFTRLFGKGIRKRLLHDRFGFLIAINRDRAFLIFAERAQVIEAKEMIDVEVCVDHCMDTLDFLTQELQTQLG